MKGYTGGGKGGDALDVLSCPDAKWGKVPVFLPMKSPIVFALLPQLDKGRNMRQSVDITRLSRIALHNLEREGEGADYSSAGAGASAVEAQQGDIRIDSADAELDFEENREEGAFASVPVCIYVGCLQTPVHMGSV